MSPFRYASSLRLLIAPLLVATSLASAVPAQAAPGAGVAMAALAKGGGTASTAKSRAEARAKSRVRGRELRKARRDAARQERMARRLAVQVDRQARRGPSLATMRAAGQPVPFAPAIAAKPAPRPAKPAPPQAPAAKGAKRPAPAFDGLVDASERWLNSLPVGSGANAAFARYRRAAKRGDAVAMANMAACLEAGRGCRRDPAAAWRCWIAAAHGSDEAIRQTVARRLMRGDGVKRDRGLARRLLAFGGLRGDARAQLALGEDLLSGAPDANERLAGLRWLARAAIAGNPGAATSWLKHAEALEPPGREQAEADLAALGRGQAAAAGPIARGSAHGPGGALVALAEAGGDAAGVPQLLERAALHDPAAMVRLAKRHQGEGGTPADPTQAAVWYRRAAVRGRVDAMLALGQLDDAEAGAWLQKAARAGSPVAMRLLGDRLVRVPVLAPAATEAVVVADVSAPTSASGESTGVAPPAGPPEPGPDLPTARRWYEAAAARGDVPALLALATHAPDPEAAARWWGLAARRNAAGAAPAHTSVVAILNPTQRARVTRDMATWALRHPRAGVAVAPPTDLPAGNAGEAARLRAYAQAGAPWAQTALGHALSVGKHVPADQAEAATWWLRAAHQGDRLAQANLTEAYAAGRGLPRDDAFAYAWWCLATDRNPTAGMAGYPYAARLTAAHISQAATLAADWRRRTSDLPEEPAP